MTKNLTLPLEFHERLDLIKINIKLILYNYYLWAKNRSIPVISFFIFSHSISPLLSVVCPVVQAACPVPFSGLHTATWWRLHYHQLATATEMLPCWDCTIILSRVSMPDLWMGDKDEVNILKNMMVFWVSKLMLCQPAMTLCPCLV